MVKLTPSEVRRIARLARLTLNDEEVTHYQQQLGEVLNYVEKLAEVNVADVPATTQVTGLTTVLADDVATPSQSPGSLLEGAPSRTATSLKVRAVFGESAK